MKPKKSKKSARSTQAIAASVAAALVQKFTTDVDAFGDDGTEMIGPLVDAYYPGLLPDDQINKPIAAIERGERIEDNLHTIRQIMVKAIDVNRRLGYRLGCAVGLRLGGAR